MRNDLADFDIILETSNGVCRWAMNLWLSSAGQTFKNHHSNNKNNSAMNKYKYLFENLVAFYIYLKHDKDTTAHQHYKF